MPSEARRTIFEPEHDLFRAAVRQFIQAEIVPHHEAWEKAKCVPRDVWAKAGAAGFLCPSVPEAYGGAGVDFKFGAIVAEELAYAGTPGPCFSLHSDIVSPYIVKYGSEAQKHAYLPGMVAGTIIGAIAMTEPGTGSDLQSIETRAVRQSDGGWRLSGAKTFITNGQLADVVIVAAKTDSSAGAKGMSLFLVDATSPGFARGRNLDKLGLHAQDTSELFFDGVAGDLLGGEGHGFVYLMNELAQERLLLAVGAAAAAETVLRWTSEYVAQRSAFGKPILDFQNTRFELADVFAETTIGRTYVDACMAAHANGELDVDRAVVAKLWLSEMQFRVTDKCLQLFGGYGYMQEYPVARAWADARVQRIYAGSNEIMREMLGRGIAARAKSASGTAPRRAADTTSPAAAPVREPVGVK